MSKKILIVIVGPTAVGKTDMAVELAFKYQTEIISADSRQFYKELNIGVAKPSKEQLNKVKHHFIGHLSVSEDYNAGAFEQEAIKKIKTLFKSKQCLIMVGGSGLYIKAVCEGFDELPDVDKKVREQIIDSYQEEGIQWLQQRLKQLDPAYYKIADIKNPQRMMRALEICISTGKLYSDFRKNTSSKRDFEIIKIGLNDNRGNLYDRINQRVDRMIESDLVDEVKSLIKYKDLNALKTVGYQEIFDYIDENLSLDEAINKIKQNTRNYAKRQLTWFRKDKNIKWFEPGNIEAINQFLKNVNCF